MKTLKKRFLCLFLVLVMSASHMDMLVAYAAPIKDMTQQDDAIDIDPDVIQADDNELDYTENAKDDDAAGDGEKESHPENPQDMPFPAPESLEGSYDADVRPEAETMEKEPRGSRPYWNYVYGDPAYSGNYMAVDEKGNELPEMYEDDLETILQMAEEGMDLARFFHGSVYEGITLAQLHEIRDSGLDLDSLTAGYLFGKIDIPRNLGRYMQEADPAGGIMLLSEGGLPSSMTATGVRQLSGGALGVEQALGASKSHGPVVKLQAAGGGTTYDGFCGSYGSSYRSNYQYHLADYHELVAPNGAALNEAQYTVIQFVIAAYLKTTMQSDTDYAGAQAAIWYAINNPSAPEEFYWRGWEGYNDSGLSVGNGPLKNIAGKIAGGNGNAVYNGIYSFIATVSLMYDAYREGHCTMEDFSSVIGFDYYPGQSPEIYFYRSDVSNAQWFIAWDIESGGETLLFSGIPIINNYYLEKEAVANYSIDITKESIITNELLEGFSFEVVESEANGHDLDYTNKTGTRAAPPIPGADYAHPEQNGGAKIGTFGQATDVLDPVPYMDDDIEPSSGAHKTVLTTDENGHASTTFVHKHTFWEYWSECLDGELKVIDKASYDALWAKALEEADALQEGQTMSVTYLGSTQQMSADEIKAIYNQQTSVYTQTRDEAMQTVNDRYNAYKDRTYTYTVTELDTYERQGDTDSNGKVMEAVPLPHDGYRKDVQDATTIGPYVQVLKDGQTMVPGGRNDQDGNTDELNVTNEPWYNQVFINKTDLETNSQILYDTSFEIYEYYQYRVNLEAAKIPVYPALILSAYRVAETNARVNPKTIAAATLHVYATGGAEVYKQELDVRRLAEAMEGVATDYMFTFTTTHSGAFTVVIETTIDETLAPDSLGERVIPDSRISEHGAACSCISDCDPVSCPVCMVSDTFCQLKGEAYSMYQVEGGEPKAEVIEDYQTLSDGSGWFSTAYSTYSSKLDNGETIYTNEATGGTYNSKDGAYIGTHISEGESFSAFFFTQPVDDVYLFSSDGGQSFTIYGTTDRYIGYEEKDGDVILYYSDGLSSGTYEEMEYWVSVDDTQITRREVDWDVDTDPEDYTTWGRSANYEIVRVTADIAKKMGWGDATIGMYTVHRLSPIDQYAGTTFTNHYDEAEKSFSYGYQEYGTLYFTQANQGLFAIVEKAAPFDGSRSGYLGNFSDRAYDYLEKEGISSEDKQSSVMDQKNYEGNPFVTADSMSEVKYVHYMDLCTNTNQYATYMLTDGYDQYSDEYYNTYVEVLTDEAGNEVPTEDGYDGLYYEQSSLLPTIGLAKLKLDDPVNDVLNTYWDQWFSKYLTKASGVQVLRDSQKTDTWMELQEKKDLIHHYVGTTINRDSFDDNDSRKSDIVYDGTCTDTAINYHSYAKEAGMLNGRKGFHDAAYLQVGDVVYDDAAEEKEARIHHTESKVSKEQGYAFIDEREYGYIRFSKYDTDAMRYVDGDLSEGYVSGTDHADANLNGAVYSLYVEETNSFTVDYLEGTMSGRLFWAQPLIGGGYTLIYDGDEDAENGFTDKGDNETFDYPHAYVSNAKADGTPLDEGSPMVLHLDYGKQAESEGTDFTDVTIKSAAYRGIQHPDGRYGGEKHNGFFAVLEKQQVFVDTNDDGYADTWTIQDVTLCNGAKVASAVIRDGELSMDGLYLGTYYLAEEIRDAITIYSVNNDDRETAENRWLSLYDGHARVLW